jgi:hypothetical protein
VNVSKQFVAVVCPSIVLGGKELPLIVTIKFTHHPGRAATPPSYASGGDPPEGESVDDIEVVDIKSDTCGPRPALECPQWLRKWIAENVDEGELLGEVDYGPDPDEMRDRMQDRESDRQAFFDEQNSGGAEE